MYEAWGRVALGDGHVQGVQDQLGAEMVGHRPADDPAGERVEDDSEVQPALTGALLGDVSDPQAVGSWWSELALDQIRGRCRGRVAASEPVPSAAVDADDAAGPHESGDTLAADPDLQPQAQLGVDAWGAVGATAAGVDLADLADERLVSQCPGGRWARGEGVLAGACHTQHAGQTGDAVVCFLRVDQPIPAHR